MPITRRSFLAGAAAAVASPALGATSWTDVDVLIVGAGAAGIAAARRVAAANRKYAVVEASDHVGGRCATDTATFGVPFDRGAHWIHAPDSNAAAMLAARAGIDVYPAPPGQKVRVGRRNAREGEMEDFLAASVRAHRAIGDAARKGDLSCAQAMPRDLADWRQTVEFVLGPYATSKDLNELSAADVARSADRDVDAFCRLGFGGLLAKLADGLPVQLSSPVTGIDWSGRGNIEIATAKGRFTARAVIVTASTSVLTANRIAFSPELPRRVADAASKLSLGSYDRIALELPGNPLGLQRDDLVFEKADSVRTAALLANIYGSPLCTVDVAGRFGRELAAKGDAAMVAFALDWLGGLFGTDLKPIVKRTAVTHWNDDPFVLGAFSGAAPGAQPARRTLMDSLNNRVWFAGEAAHETLWGTVGGAWESGDRAAAEALKKFGSARDPERPKRTSRRK